MNLENLNAYYEARLGDECQVCGAERMRVVEETVLHRLSRLVGLLRTLKWFANETSRSPRWNISAPTPRQFVHKSLVKPHCNGSLLMIRMPLLGLRLSEGLSVSTSKPLSALLRRLLSVSPWSMPRWCQRSQDLRVIDEAFVNA